MKSEPAQEIDLALKSVNLLVLLARAICKRFSKISIPFKMLDLRPILASFMGDAQPSKNKQQQKKTVKTNQLSDSFSDTRWRYRFHWVCYRGAWIKRENPVLFSCSAFKVPWNRLSRILEQAGLRPPTERSLYGSWNGVCAWWRPTGRKYMPFPLLLTSTWKPVQLKQTRITASPT